MTGHIKMAKSANICVTIIKVQKKKVIKNIGKNNLIVYINIDLGLKQSLKGVI